jgi:flagellar L-ring protein precursor FlgH
MMKNAVALLALAALLPAAASADTLYVSAPPAVGPGHPLRLGPDHRASQVGDLIHVQFNFTTQSFSSDVSNDSKQFNAGASSGSTGTQGGVKLLNFIRIPTSVGGQTGTQSSKTENGTTGFTSDMEATVIGVLPSGALEIAGDQRMIVNGQSQVLHVTGYVRPEDVDSSDTVLSTRIANVQGTFSGNFQEKNVGLVRRVLNWLF